MRGGITPPVFSCRSNHRNIVRLFIAEAHKKYQLPPGSDEKGLRPEAYSSVAGNSDRLQSTYKELIMKKNVSDGRLAVKIFYGWVPDIPDQRDYLLSAILKVPAKLPKAVDLRNCCSNIED
jgi:hypothetical protein